MRMQAEAAHVSAQVASHESPRIRRKTEDHSLSKSRNQPLHHMALLHASQAEIEAL